MSLRIAMIGQRGVPATFGGVERHVEEIGSRLALRGHDVTVFCRPNYSGLAPRQHRGMHLVYHQALATKHFEALSQCGRAALATLNDGYDVVHFHAIGPGIFTPLPRYLSGATVVQTIHGFDQERAKWGRTAQTMLNTAGWMSARVPHATIVVSQSLQEAYWQRYRRETVHIGNGAPEPAFRPASAITEQYGLSTDPFILFVGRLVPEKAPDLLIRALGRIDRDIPLVIAGGSSFTHGYVEALHKLARQDSRVIMTGFVFGDVLQELYSNAALFVLPSLLEGLPLTLLEALSYDRSVVASSIPPHLEVLGDSGPARRLVPPGDIEALASSITEALDRRGEEQRAAKEFGEEVRARYSWDAATDATEALYLSLGARTPADRSPRWRRSQSRAS